MPVSADRTRIAVGDMLRQARKQPGTSLVPGAATISVEVVASPMASASLVALARGGDRSAFDSIVEQELDRAYRVARAILGSDADAWDATQEALVHAWTELPRLRDPDRFEGWLRAILVNSCRLALRSRRRRLVREIATSDPTEGPAAVAGCEDPPDERVADVDSLERAFERLSVDERAILVLHHVERRPLVEVAEALAIPVGTAKSRLFAARQQLERALEVEGR